MLDALQYGVRKAAAAATSWVEETFDIETLTDKDDTSPENNSSAIVLLSVDGHHSLLTADAGKAALGDVLDRLEGVDEQILANWMESRVLRRNDDACVADSETQLLRWNRGGERTEDRGDAENCDAACLHDCRVGHCYRVGYCTKL